MTYTTTTLSNTFPARYHILQTSSLWIPARSQKRGAKPCQALSSSQTTTLSLMRLEVSIICQCLSSIVDCAVGFKSHDFQSTTSPQVTHSPVGLQSLLSLLVLYARNVSKIVLQPGGPSFIVIRSHSVPNMGCAVGVEIGITCWTCGVVIWDASTGQC